MKETIKQIRELIAQAEKNGIVITDINVDRSNNEKTITVVCEPKQRCVVTIEDIQELKDRQYECEKRVTL